MTHIFCYQSKLFSRNFLVFRFFHNLFCYLFICHLTERSNLQQHVKSIHDGVKHVKFIHYGVGLNTVVSSVTIRQLWKATFTNTERSNLQQHVKSIYDGVKHSCEFFDYRATTKSSLQRHVMSIHDGVKHSCEFCEYKATTKSSL